jgi:glycosyltransferase involved in cell wall biosynthesis
MALRETMVHGETAFLAGVAREIQVTEAMLGQDHGFEEGHRVVFPSLKTADYRADVQEVADYLLQLMEDAELRRRMGAAGRKRALEQYDYRVIARRLVELVTDRLDIN